jgi:predicted nucleic acid-binding protein
MILDTSTLVGAILLPRSVPRQAFMQALACGTLCASAATLAELEQVLLRKKFDRYTTHATHNARRGRGSGLALKRLVSHVGHRNK